VTESVVEKARRFVTEQLEGEGKDATAAMKILRKRVKDRHDDMSVAIRTELDRRASPSDSLADWPGWE
jgi:hypothetical protein